MFYCFIRWPLFQLNFAIHVHGFIFLSITFYLACFGPCFQSTDSYFVKKHSLVSPTIFTPRLQSPTASQSPAAGAGAPWCSKDFLTQPLPSKGLKRTDEQIQVLSSGAMCREGGRNEAAVAVDSDLWQWSKVLGGTEEKHLVIVEWGKVTEDRQVFAAPLNPSFMVTLTLENLPPLLLSKPRAGIDPTLSSRPHYPSSQFKTSGCQPQHGPDDLEGREKANFLTDT